MADEADISSDMQQKILDVQISNVSKKSSFNIHGTGFCIVCGADVEPIMSMLDGKMQLVTGRWCGDECRKLS